MAVTDAVHDRGIREPESYPAASRDARVWLIALFLTFVSSLGVARADQPPGGEAYGHVLAMNLGRTRAQPAAGQYLPAGTRLTYRQAVSSTPGSNAGPDARGVASQGFVQVDINYADATACVATVTLYSQALTVDSLIPNATDFSVSDGRTCSYVWVSPSVLASYQAAPGGIETVERGPFQHNGRAYNAIMISSAHQNTRSWLVYDLDSGMLLSMTEGTGDRSNPDGTSQGSASSGVQELISVRQLDLPWTSNQSLPPQLQNLTALTYRGQLVQSTPGVTLFDTSVTTQLGMTITVQERKPAWLRAQQITTLSMMGVALEPLTQQVVLNAGSGHFLLPEVISGLQAGQLLDTDPVTGYRSWVERADGSGVVLVTEGRGYRLVANFDSSSGLLLSSWSERNEGSTLRTSSLELIGWQ